MLNVAKLTVFLVSSALLLGACDSGDEDEGSASGDMTEGGDRAADILMIGGDAAAGNSVFTANCGIAGCHQPDGSGGPNVMPLGSVVPNLSDGQMVEVLLNGGDTMPSQAARSDQELADVLAYLNAQFGG